MPYKDLPPELVDQLRPTDVQAYARSTGWERVEGVSGPIAVYRRPNQELYEILIPQDRDLADFHRRMAEVVAELAAVESRPATSVLHDLLLPPADILRFPLRGPVADGDSVPLETGLKLLDGARKTLLAAACDVLQPRPFHPRLTLSDAEQFVSACRMGHTERGSFIARVICPLSAGADDELQAQTAFDFGHTREPFTRRVTTHVMSSVSHIVKSIIDDHVELLVRPSDARPLISANFYEALASLQPMDDRSSVQINAHWSASYPVRPSVASSVQLRKEYFPYIERAAFELRPRAEPRRDTYIGRVIAAQRESGDDELVPGEVVLAFLSEDELFRARLILEPQDFADACDALKLGQYVSVSAVLHRGSRIHRLTDPAGFTRLTNEALRAIAAQGTNGPQAELTYSE